MRESINACRGHWNEAGERTQFEHQLDLTTTNIISTDGADVGFVMLIRNSDTLQIHTLCIAPEYQGQGIGSKVTMDIINHREDDKGVVVLSVLKVNLRAVALYSRLGFTVADESEHHYHLKYDG
jgi:ribosomal protein S18 acetylase RimI-like enzyme